MGSALESENRKKAEAFWGEYAEQMAQIGPEDSRDEVRSALAEARKENERGKAALTALLDSVQAQGKAEARVREMQETHERNDVAFDSMDQCYRDAAELARKFDAELSIAQAQVREFRAALDGIVHLALACAETPAERAAIDAAYALLARTETTKAIVEPAENASNRKE